MVAQIQAPSRINRSRRPPEVQDVLDSLEAQGIGLYEAAEELRQAGCVDLARTCEARAAALHERWQTVVRQHPKVR